MDSFPCSPHHPSPIEADQNSFQKPFTMVQWYNAYSDGNTMNAMTSEASKTNNPL